MNPLFGALSASNLNYNYNSITLLLSGDAMTDHLLGTVDRTDIVVAPVPVVLQSQCRYGARRAALRVILLFGLPS